MDEIINVKGKNFVTYDLLCNIGTLAGRANVEYLKENYPEMEKIKTGSYNESDFEGISGEMFLEYDYLNSEAILLEEGSPLEVEIGSSLHNNPILSQKHYDKIEDEILMEEFGSRFTVLNDLIEDMPEKTQSLLLNAIEKNNDEFPWKKVLSETISDPSRFYIHPLSGSSEVSVVIKMTNEEKHAFRDNVEKEAGDIVKKLEKKNKNRMKP